MPEGLLRILLFGDTVAIHLALALVLGCMASDLWLSPSASAWGDGMARRAGRIRRLGFLLGVVAILGLWWLQATSMGEVADLAVGAAAWTLLKDTHLGHAAVSGFVGWSLAAVAVWPADRVGAQTRHWFRRLAASAGLALFVWSRSVVSHAGSQGDWSRYVLVDWVHLVLVSLWVGIVLVAAATKLPAAVSRKADGIAAAQWIASLSTTATVALVGIVLTGAFKTWVSVPAVVGLWASDYGVLLSIKLGLVLVAVALGGYNRFWVLPFLFLDLKSAQGHAAGRWRRHLVWAFRLEAAVLVLVLITAAVLSGTESPSMG